MTTDPRLARARHLLAVDRPAEAASELTSLLAEAPDSVEVRILLAQASVGLERYDEATDHVGHAVRLAPDVALTWLVAARVFLLRHRLDDAERAIAESIRLQPRDSDAHAIRAAIRFQRSDWEGARAAAEAGIELDPEHAHCTNLLAMALTRLGDRGRAAHLLRGQLARAPDDALTHANQGWTELHAGRYDRALEHFREALRLDPGDEWARRGILEALKGRHWLYRPVLRYFLWMERLSTRAQFAILFGGWLGYQAVRGLASGDSPLRPVLLALMALYLTFALSTWFAGPLANGLLCLSRFGRLALTGWEKLSAAVLLPLLAVGVAAVLGGFGPDLVVPGLALGLLAFPLAVMFQLPAGKARVAMLAYTLLVASLGGLLAAKDRRVTRERQALRPWIELAEAAKEAEANGEDPVEALRETEGWRPTEDEVQALPARLAALQDDSVTTRNLALLVSLLAFFGSQLAGAAAARWAARR